MARAKFLRNLDQVAGFLSPELHANGIRLGPDALRAALERRGVWPLVHAVEGFDPNDFPDLDPAKREQLVRAIEVFRDCSTPTAGQPPLSRADGERALAAFVSILTLMQPYLPGFEVYAALRSQPFPGFVRDFAVKVGKDSTGDPAAWVWVVVDDREAGNKLYPRAKQVQELVEDALDQADINLWPYVFYRTESEQAELESEQGKMKGISRR